MTDGTEETHCARGNRCRSATSVYVDDRWRRIPALTPRGFCDHDADLVRQVIGIMPGRFIDLWSYLGMKFRAGNNGGGAPGKSGSSVPVNVVIDALMREIIEVSVSWEDRVRTVARLSPRVERVRAHVALVNACTLLQRHHLALLALDESPVYRSRDLTDRRPFPAGTVGVSYSEDAGWASYHVPLTGRDAGLEFLYLAHRIKSTLRETRQPQPTELTCVTCGHRTIERRDGYAGLEDEATCHTCGDVYGPARYDEVMREQHAEALIRKKARGRRKRVSVAA